MEGYGLRLQEPLSAAIGAIMTGMKDKPQLLEDNVEIAYLFFVNIEDVESFASTLELLNTRFEEMRETRNASYGRWTLDDLIAHAQCNSKQTIIVSLHYKHDLIHRKVTARQRSPGKCVLGEAVRSVDKHCRPPVAHYRISQ